MIKERIKRKILPSTQDEELIDLCLSELRKPDSTGKNSTKGSLAIYNHLKKTNSNFEICMSIHPEEIGISYKILKIIDGIEEDYLQNQKT